MKNGECRGAKPLCREPEGVPQIQISSLSSLERAPEGWSKEFFSALIGELKSSQASSASSKLDVLTRFKGDGGRLYGETCPQYLDLTNQEMLDHGPLAKIGPPLREPGDNEAMWRGLAERLIDTVGSDFCGFNKSQKYSGGQSVGATVDRPDIEEGSASIFDASFGGNWAEQMLR